MNTRPLSAALIGFALMTTASLSPGQTTNPTTTVPAIDPAAARAVDDLDLITKLTGGADLGNSAPQAPALKIARVIQRMGQSSSRLVARDPGPQTQEVQHRIVSDLDDLIDMLKKNQDANPTDSPAPSPTDPAPATPTATDRTSTSGNSPATSSQPRAGQPATPATRGSLIETRTAGMNLPWKDRAAILNGITHGCLPEYKDMVSRYYEALANLRSPDPSQ